MPSSLTATKRKTWLPWEASADFASRRKKQILVSHTHSIPSKYHTERPPHLLPYPALWAASKKFYLKSHWEIRDARVPKQEKWPFPVYWILKHRMLVAAKCLGWHHWPAQHQSSGTPSAQIQITRLSLSKNSKSPDMSSTP